MVVAPCVALYLYLALLISPQYESVSTFVIRGDGVILSAGTYLAPPSIDTSTAAIGACPP